MTANDTCMTVLEARSAVAGVGTASVNSWNREFMAPLARVMTMSPEAFTATDRP